MVSVEADLRAGKVEHVEPWLYLSSARYQKQLKSLEICLAAAKQSIGDDAVVTWMPDDGQFYAIPATPHGAGQVYLLKTYPVGLGWKTISNISVFYLNGLNSPQIWFRLKPHCGREESFLI